MEEGKYRDGHGGGKQPLPWRLNSARVPGGKNIPGWDSIVQFLRLAGTDTEIWACGSSQLSLRRQASRAGTSWSPWSEGKTQDVRMRTPEPSPSLPTLSSFPSNTQAFGLPHATLIPSPLLKNVDLNPHGHPVSNALPAWVMVPTPVMQLPATGGWRQGTAVPQVQSS